MSRVADQRRESCFLPKAGHHDLERSQIDWLIYRIDKDAVLLWIKRNSTTGKPSPRGWKLRVIPAAGFICVPELLQMESPTRCPVSLS